MDRVNRSLVALPGSVRQRRRREILDSVLSGLPEGFPRVAASKDATDAARQRLEDVASSL
jgi:N-methylhydantoinase B